jgi:hypothetical protein
MLLLAGAHEATIHQVTALGSSFLMADPAGR